MDKSEKRDWFRLSSGREFYANCHIIGLVKEHDGQFEVHEGYDGSIDLKSYGDDPDWTPAECAELADYMIALWAEFKAKHGG